MARQSSGLRISRLNKWYVVLATNENILNIDIRTIAGKKAKQNGLMFVLYVLGEEDKVKNFTISLLVKQSPSIH